MRFAESIVTYSKQEMSRNWNVVSDIAFTLQHGILYTLGEPIPKF